jgi:hypothetical protein
MVSVENRNVILNKTCFKFISILFSRIVLNKLDDASKEYFRKLENILVKNEKINADLSFLKYKVRSQL